MICCYIIGVSIYTCIRGVYAVYALLGWQGQIAYNCPCTVHYTSTAYKTAYYTHLKSEISVYPSPTVNERTSLGTSCHVARVGYATRPGRPTTPGVSVSCPPDVECLSCDVTVEELHAMIKRLKRGKSPGMNGILAEKIKDGV